MFFQYQKIVYFVQQIVKKKMKKINNSLTNQNT
jgi:hypothetical protein